MRFTMLVLALVLGSVSGVSAQGWIMDPQQATARYGSASFAQPAPCQNGGMYTQVYVPQQVVYSAPCQTYYRRPSALAVIAGVAIGLSAGRNNYYGNYGYGYGGGTYQPAVVQTARYSGVVSAPADRAGGYSTNVGLATYSAPVRSVGGNGGYSTNVGMPTYSVRGLGKQ